MRSDRSYGTINTIIRAVKKNQNKTPPTTTNHKTERLVIPMNFKMSIQYLFFNMFDTKTVNFITIFSFPVIKHSQGKYQGIYLEQKPLKLFCFLQAFCYKLKMTHIAPCVLQSLLMTLI